MQESLIEYSDNVDLSSEFSGGYAEEPNGDSNENISFALKDIVDYLLNNYISNEEHNRRFRKVISGCIIFLCFAQILFLNVIISFIILCSFFDNIQIKNLVVKVLSDVQYTQMVDLVKYYVCATIIEILAIIATMVSKTFSDKSASKLLGLILEQTKKMDIKNKKEDE